MSFPGSSDSKNLPAMWETQVQFLGQENTLEKEMATRSSILAWRIPQTEEPGRLQSMGSQRVRQNRATNADCTLILIIYFLILRLSSQSQVIMFLGYSAVFQNKIMKIYSWYWNFGMHNKICKYNSLCFKDKTLSYTTIS